MSRHVFYFRAIRRAMVDFLFQDVLQQLQDLDRYPPLEIHRYSNVHRLSS